MTRTTLRGLLGLVALLVLALVSGCASSQPPAPTPDPFASVAERSDQAFHQGLEAYAQGQYRDAQTAFEQAKLLSPSDDPRIDNMLDRTRAALAPTATPVPPMPTSVPPTPTVAPVTQSTATPDADLGRRYFGQVTLAVVPGRDADAVAATTFFFQDQLGLQIDGLKQHLRLPLELRVFNADTGQLVASVKSDDASPTPIAPTPQAAPSLDQAVAAAAAGAAVPSPSPSPATVDAHLVRFYDSWIWYHQGGETPGHYRLELYGNGVLTNTFDYSVSATSLPAPATPTAATAEATETTTVPAEPTATPEAVPPAPPAAPEVAPPPPTTPPAPRSVPVVAAPAAPAVTVAPTTTPQPTLQPSPTPVPTPAHAYTTPLGGLPAGLDVNDRSGQFYLADASGVIWTADAAVGQERPSLATPIHVDGSAPADLAVDQTTGNLFVASRTCSCIIVLNRAGQRLTTIPLGTPPGDLRLDSDLGLLSVVLPAQQAVAEIFVRNGQVVGTIGGLSQISSLALDPLRHTLYATQLTGELDAIDPVASRLTARWTLSTAGLSSVATARGLVYAVNPATHELAVLDPAASALSTYHLSQEPAAVAASEATGAVYVLSSRASTMLQIDPTDGTELGRVTLGDRSGRASAQLPTSQLQTLHPRLVLDAQDESLFASLPEAGTLASLTNDEFPTLAREIPYVASAPITAATSSTDQEDQ